MPIKVGLHPLIAILTSIYFHNILVAADLIEDILITRYERRSKSQFSVFPDMERLCSSYLFKSSFMLDASKKYCGGDGRAVSDGL